MSMKAKAVLEECNRRPTNEEGANGAIVHACACVCVHVRVCMQVRACACVGVGVSGYVLVAGPA